MTCARTKPMIDTFAVLCDANEQFIVAYGDAGIRGESQRRCSGTTTEIDFSKRAEVRHD